jgi:hypothetical protein
MRRSAGRGLFNLAHSILTRNRIREPQAHPDRSDRSARFVTAGHGCPSRTRPAGNLRQPGEVKAAKIQARQWGDKTLSGLPEFAPTRPSIWEAVPDNLTPISCRGRLATFTADGLPPLRHFVDWPSLLASQVYARIFGRAGPRSTVTCEP